MCSASQPWSRAHGRDPQREALLAEQRVAAVAGADAPDRAVLGEVQDEAAIGREVADASGARAPNRPRRC